LTLVYQGSRTAEKIAYLGFDPLHRGSATQRRRFPSRELPRPPVGRPRPVRGGCGETPVLIGDDNTGRRCTTDSSFWRQRCGRRRDRRGQSREQARASQPGQRPILIMAPRGSGRRSDHLVLRVSYPMGPPMLATHDRLLMAYRDLAHRAACATSAGSSGGVLRVATSAAGTHRTAVTSSSWAAGSPAARST
jgi:hypothetical protein